MIENITCFPCKGMIESAICFPYEGMMDFINGAKDWHLLPVDVVNREAVYVSNLTVNRFTSKVVYGRMSMASKSKGSPLVELRERVGITQEALANALGVTDHTVRNWEKGRAEPKLTLKQFKTLCRLLRCTAEDLPDSFAPGGDD